MNPELEQLVAAMPEDVPRSRLDPYREAILLWRRRGHSYRKIVGVLLKERGVSVTHETLRRYVLRRSRPRKGASDLPPSEPPASASADRWAAERERMRQHKKNGSGTAATPEPKLFEYTDEDASKPLYVEPVRRKSQEELIAQRDAIRAAYEKPTIPLPAVEKKRFVFDPDKPPVNKNYENGKE